MSSITLNFLLLPREFLQYGESVKLNDMYGLIPVGLPDERRLVLPDDWPEDMYPLRKDAMDYRQRPTPTAETELIRL